MKFPIAIHKDTNSIYGVTVPDIEGCFSWGNTLDDAICNVKEAIYSHVETLRELNQSIDFKASQIEKLSVLDDFKDAIWAVVEIDITFSNEFVG
jgi:predicted RNase H-like HicB family nuclease